ncbi:MAG: 7-cyano-7-deazaguanine synthase QueC [Candidatus Marinimicrobia bacterium]|nr:7-cyano-7-deazaguanine synthase QueC [Candidatus Neomarinimicrobiota bacterium]
MKALVLLSGGQDSSTCLFWSLKNAEYTEAVFFKYGQRHMVEWECAQVLCREAGVPLHVLNVPAFQEIGGTAMIEEIAIKMTQTGVPNTFVPGRNIVFLALAASLAYRRTLDTLVVGVNEEDYSGYPDCREQFIIAMEKALQEGLNYHLTIKAPLQHLSKKSIWALADELNVMDTIIEKTHTCYKGDHVTRHPWGYGCGTCPACLLRKIGFEAYQEERHENS